jgi:hypothetical protein
VFENSAERKADSDVFWRQGEAEQARGEPLGLKGAYTLRLRTAVVSGRFSAFKIEIPVNRTQDCRTRLITES